MLPDIRIPWASYGPDEQFASGALYIGLCKKGEMKKLFAFVVLTYLGLGPSVSMARKVTRFMPEPSNCGKIVETNDSKLPAAHLWWVMGSLSANAVYIDDNDSNERWPGLVDHRGSKYVEEAVITYCQRNPLRDLSDAALAVNILMGGGLWKPPL